MIESAEPGAAVQMDKFDEVALIAGVSREVIERVMQRAGGKQEFIAFLPQMHARGICTDFVVQDGNIVRLSPTEGLQ